MKIFYLKNSKKIKKINTNLGRFGLLFGSMFIVSFLYMFLVDQNMPYFILIFGSIILFLSFTYPNIFKPFYAIWMNIPIFMSFFLTPIILFTLYCFFIIPVGIFFKIKRKNLLDLKINLNKNSYWSIIKSDQNDLGNLKDQF